MNQEHRSGGDRRNKDGAVWNDRRHNDCRVSPAVGEFAIQDAAKLRQINKELVEALRVAKRGHYQCEDGWFSCPKSEEGCLNHEEGSGCNCGADTHNARIDAAIAKTTQ